VTTLNNNGGIMEPLEDKVLRDIQEIIAEFLCCEVNDITSDARLVDLGADSLDMVEIVMEIEEKYNIEIYENDLCDIGTNNLTVGLLVDVVVKEI
jgi:acyl carrier protein